MSYGLLTLEPFGPSPFEIPHGSRFPSAAAASSRLERSSNLFRATGGDLSSSSPE